MRTKRRVRIARGLSGPIAMLIAVLALPAAASSTEPDRSGAASVKLGGDQPFTFSGLYEAGAGEWLFAASANKQVESISIHMTTATDAGCSETVYQEKMNSDELADGTASRAATFEAGTYCLHLTLDGQPKAEATVDLTFPIPPEPEPETTATPAPDPSEDPVQPPYDASIEYIGLFDKDGKTLVPARCTDLTAAPRKDDPYASEIDHQVLAGAIGPDHNAPFIYTSFYPEILQVHQGDVVEWCMNGSYDWHSISFFAQDMDVATHPEPQEDLMPRMARADEAGHTAFGEEWLHGPGLGDPANPPCGRGPYMRQSPETDSLNPAQPICVLNDSARSVGSSIFDRFVGLNRPMTFRVKVDLAPGVYRYHCNLHPQMDGFIEVLPPEAELDNPTVDELAHEIHADFTAAEELRNELADPSNAYDHETGEWVVHVGAETHDGDVAIEEFLPSRVDVRQGDVVRYVGEMQEPNTVTFPGDPHVQGGFVFTKKCGPHHCDGNAEVKVQGNTLASRDVAGPPTGMVGLAFVWGCDPDEMDSGAPMIPLAFLTAQTQWRSNGATPYGCPPGTGRPEFRFQSWMADPQPAPGNLVGPNTYHNSGFLMSEESPDWYRKRPATPASDAPMWLAEFEAKFPVAGTFPFLCAAHEFMNGKVVVR